MAEDADETVNLPARVSVLGPLDSLAFRVHMMIVSGACLDALRAADDYEPFVRAAGDEMTLSFLDQCRMYAFQALGRYQEALAAGLAALRRRRELGWIIGQAKTLSNVAELYFHVGDLVQGMSALARATLLLERCRPSEFRYVSATTSAVGTAITAELYELAESLLERILATVRRDGAPLVETLLLAQHSGLADSMLPVYGDLQLQWGLRLEQMGRAEEAAARFRRCVESFRAYLEVTAISGSQVTGSPHGALALALAKLGAVDEAAAIAKEDVVRQRDRQQYYNVLVAHLAYAVALRTLGDRGKAHRELVAAEQMYRQIGDLPTWRLTIQHELVLNAIADLPRQAADVVLTAIRAQATRLWELRLQGVSMLREARRQQELDAERVAALASMMRDELTGIDNRRRFDRLIAELDSAGTPAGQAPPMALILIDVDDFKKINDRYSHSVGDRVLAEFGAILRTTCRPHDVPVRFGGDEFAVFLQADLPQAMEIAERIRRAVLDRDWSRIAIGLRVTVSAGAAAYEATLTGQRLFEAADQRLYEAKRRGRNRIAA